MENMGTK